MGNIFYLEEMLPITFKCRILKQAGLSKNSKLSTNVTLILFRSRNEFFTIYVTYTVKRPPVAPKLRKRLRFIPIMHGLYILDKQ